MKSIKHPSAWVATAMAFTLVLSGGCGSEDKGTNPVSGSVRFEPAPGDLTVVAFLPIEFRAFDENGDPVTAQFTLDGDVIAIDTRLPWRGEELGDRVLVAEAERGGKTFSAQWTIHVTDEGAEDPPTVLVVDAVPGALPGSIAVSWSRPSASLHPTPIDEYELAYSSTPLVDLAAYEAAPRLVVPDNPDAITQHQALEGLSERIRYYLRLRVRDRLDRQSVLSAEFSSEATGHFDVTGRVYEMDRTPQAPVPLNRVLLDLEGVKAFTNASGDFALSNVPDLSSRTLSAIEDQQFVYYSILTEPLAPVSRSFEFLLFPRTFIVIDDEEVPLLNYLKIMSSNTGNSDTEFHRWDQYPVEIYAHPYVNDSLVDYRQAMITACARWNDQAGEELLRVVDSMPEVGGYYATDVAAGEGLHGQVKLERPIGQLYEVTPELVRVRLRPDFSTQDVADRIIGHELGHVLLLAHSPSPIHLMNIGSPSSTGGIPHRDEAYVARIIAHMPAGTDARWYTEPAGAR